MVVWAPHSTLDHVIPQTPVTAAAAVTATAAATAAPPSPQPPPQLLPAGSKVVRAMLRVPQ